MNHVAPWMNEYLPEVPKTLSAWRGARAQNRSWRYLSKYGKLVSFIFCYLELDGSPRDTWIMFEGTPIFFDQKLP